MWEKLCTGYQATYINVLNENPGFVALGAKTMCHFCGSSAFGNYAIIWVFGSPDQLSSLSEAKIMAHKPKIGCQFKSHKRWPWLFWLKAKLTSWFSYSNPLKTWKSLVLYNKFFFSFGLGIFSWWLQDGDRLFFGWCHRLIQWADFFAQNFFGFWAPKWAFGVLDRLSSISGSKVMAKKFQIFQECYRTSVGISLINL